MSKLFRLILFAFALAGLTGQAVWADAETTSTAASPVADKWAVVIGVSQFADKSINLKYAAKDAGDFRNFLVTKCNFAADHVRLLTNEQATKENVLDLLGDSFLPRVALPDDLVVIYFSSHGSASDLDLRGVNYLIAHDTAVDRLYSMGIEIQTLSNIVKSRIHCNRVLIILDACHSGGAGDDGASKGIHRVSNVDATSIAQGTGRAVICSSTKDQSSWESKNYSNGVFTKTLIDGFNSQGNKTTLDSAFKYLKTNVEMQVAAERGQLQTPVLAAGKWSGGDLFLGARPAGARPVPAQVVAVLEARMGAKAPTVASVSQAVSQTTNVGIIQERKDAPEAVAPLVIPNIVGSFIGSNGMTYTYWQDGRKCGWSMPLFGVVGKCTISDDGAILKSSWQGSVSGTSTAKLEVDASGKVVKIVADDGITLSRLAN